MTPAWLHPHLAELATAFALAREGGAPIRQLPIADPGAASAIRDLALDEGFAAAAPSMGACGWPIIRLQRLLRRTAAALPFPDLSPWLAEDQELSLDQLSGWLATAKQLGHPGLVLVLADPGGPEPAPRDRLAELAPLWEAMASGRLPGLAVILTGTAS